MSIRFNGKNGSFLGAVCITVLLGGCGPKTDSEPATKSDSPPTRPPQAQQPPQPQNQVPPKAPAPAKPSDEARDHSQQKPPGNQAKSAPTEQPKSSEQPQPAPPTEPSKQPPPPAQSKSDGPKVDLPGLPPFAPAPGRDLSDIPPVIIQPNQPAPQPVAPAPPPPPPSSVPPEPPVPGPGQQPQPQPPPVAALSEAPKTTLEALFKQYMDERADTDQLEERAAKIGVHLFDEEDQIRPKLWELRNLSEERRAATQSSDETIYRLHLLENGIANAAGDERVRAFLREAGTVVGISALVAALSGLHVHPPTVGTLWNTTKSTGSLIVNGTKRLFGRARDAQESGKRVGWKFQTLFRRATPEESLNRDLFTLLRGQTNIIERLQPRRITNPEEIGMIRQSNYLYRQTNLPNVRITEVHDSSAMVHFLIRVLPKRLFSRGEATYFRTTKMMQEDAKTFAEQMIAGRKDPLIVLPGQGGGDVSRVSASRFKNFAAAVRDRGARWNNEVERRAHNFDRNLAARRFVYTGGLLTAGYVLASRSESLYSDIYLDSLMAKASANERGRIPVISPLSGETR